MSSRKERACIPPDQMEKAKEAIRVLSTIDVSAVSEDQEQNNSSNG